jgi:2-oxoglutarate ferredoxin oxidoreductase subunit beta
MRLMHETHTRGEFATGVLYIEPDKDNLLEQLNLVDTPLAFLAPDVVRPGREVLDAVMEEHR